MAKLIPPVPPFVVTRDVEPWSQAYMTAVEVSREEVVAYLYTLAKLLGMVVLTVSDAEHVLNCAAHGEINAMAISQDVAAVIREQLPAGSREK